MTVSGPVFWQVRQRRSRGAVTVSMMFGARHGFLISTARRAVRRTREAGGILEGGARTVAKSPKVTTVLSSTIHRQSANHVFRRSE